MPPCRKAVCIGVNYTGSGADLRGPVNDALNWVDVLSTRCDFKRSNVLAMIDEYPSGEPVSDDDTRYVVPTKENILEALDWLVDDVSAGDVVLLTFSGHGVQITDGVVPSGSDKIDEAICPVDWNEFDWGVVPYRLITSEDLHRYFSRLPSGCLLTVILDAAICGPAVYGTPLGIDMEYPDRELDIQRVTQAEYLKYDFNCDAWLRSRKVSALPRRLPCEPQRPLWSRLSRLLAKDTAPPLSEGIALFCITACRAEQTALDASLEGVVQGCFTYCLLQAFEQYGFRCSYLELLEAAASWAARIRIEVIPSMDQFFQIYYAKNAGPDECLVLNPASAFIAKDRARRRRGTRTQPRG